MTQMTRTLRSALPRAEFCGCPSSTGVTQLATGACAQGTTCSGGAVAGTYVTVSTKATYNTIAPVSGEIFSITIPSSYTLTGVCDGAHPMNLKQIA